MTDTVKIAGIDLPDTMKPWDNGDRFLAHFDCEVRGFRLNACLLIRTARDTLLAQPPKGDSKRGEARAVQIIDKALRDEIAGAAHRAFLALGGEEAA